MFQFNKYGADPEFFIIGVDGKPLSSFNVLDSDNIQLDSCQIYCDNCLVEASFQPANSLAEFESKLVGVMQEADDYLQVGGHSLGLSNGMLFDKSQLCDMRAHQIGCEPFSSAFQPGVRFTPQPYSDGWRFAGGHIHFAYDKNLVPEHILVRMLDEALYDIDESFRDSRRDHFYGMRGAYRSKPYGVEYRSLPVSWMATPKLRAKVLTGILSVEEQINIILEGD